MVSREELALKRFDSRCPGCMYGNIVPIEPFFVLSRTAITDFFYKFSSTTLQRIFLLQCYARLYPPATCALYDGWDRDYELLTKCVLDPVAGRLLKSAHAHAAARSPAYVYRSERFQGHLSKAQNKTQRTTCVRNPHHPIATECLSLHVVECSNEFELRDR